MSHQALLEKIKNKNYDPIYFLYGEEDYFIDLIVDTLDQVVLSAAEKAFNRIVLYGKEVSGRQVRDQLDRYPMMASHQLVLLKEAQYFKDWDYLIPYFQKPNPTTIFGVAYKSGSPDKRKKWFKALKLNNTTQIIESKRIYDNKIPSWINNYLKRSNKKINPQASRLLSIFLGNNLSNVANELDKLIILLGDDDTILLDHVEQNIGVSKHYNIFELQDALGTKNISKTNYISKNLVSHLKTQPLVMIIQSLHSFFSKVYALHSLTGQSDDAVAKQLGIYSRYFVKDYRRAVKNYSPQQLEQIFDLLNKYDARLKGIDGSRLKDHVILEELIQQIIFS